ncbi:MAG: phosphate ABC transporter permease PstA [Chloroflexales bacterium]
MSTTWLSVPSGTRRRRNAISTFMLALTVLATLIAVTPLLFILGWLLIQGVRYLNLDFFLNDPAPIGEAGGGVRNGIIGTLIMSGIALLIAVPVGVLTGIFLAEYRGNPLATVVRFATDVLAGIPSIVVGIFVYTIIVLPRWFQGAAFSGFAGGVALAVIIIPILVRTTEEILRLVPGSIREAAAALGVPKWDYTLTVVVPSAFSGIATGVMLGLARAAGETAPLLLTALGNNFYNTKLDQPMAALSLQIFTYAIAPFEEGRRLAFAAAFVLIMLVLLVNIVTRYVFRVRSINL